MQELVHRALPAVGGGCHPPILIEYPGLRAITAGVVSLNVGQPALAGALLQELVDGLCEIGQFAGDLPIRHAPQPGDAVKKLVGEIDHDKVLGQLHRLTAPPLCNLPHILPLADDDLDLMSYTALPSPLPRIKGRT